jgi:hypothetical protein
MKNTSKADGVVFLRPVRVHCDEVTEAKFSTLEWIAIGASASETLDATSPSVQEDVSNTEERWMTEAATALAEFAVKAHMQGFGIDRRTAVQSIRKALESI